MCVCEGLCVEEREREKQGASPFILRLPFQRITPTDAETCLFAAADTDGDGRVSGSEAKTFFSRTGLAAADLAAVWDGAKAAAPDSGSAGAGGLDPPQFAAALRLAAMVQGGRPPDVAALAGAAGRLPRLHGVSVQAAAPAPPPPPPRAPPDPCRRTLPWPPPLVRRVGGWGGHATSAGNRSVPSGV